MGWWGDNPPYHTPVFVLTHHARPSITMDGGTTFHFVTEGIREALARARDAAKDQDVRLGGGVATIRQYLEAGFVDEMHLAIAPVLLGTGESLLTGIDLLRLGYRVSEHVAARRPRMSCSQGRLRESRHRNDFRQATRYSCPVVPLYEYACKNCSTTFEELSSRLTDDAKCPKCGTAETQRILFSRVAVGGPSRAEAVPAPCGRCGDPRGPGACGMN